MHSFQSHGVIPSGINKRFVKSVQNIFVTIANGQSTATETINAVDLSRSAIFYGGCISSENANATNWADDLARVTLENSTTVRATRGNATADDNCLVYLSVVEFTPAAVVGVQYGTVNTGTASKTHNASISSVNTANSVVHWLGMEAQSGVASQSFAKLELTSSTNVRSTKGANNANGSIHGFCVIEFNPNIIDSIQKVDVSVTTSGSASITAVDMSRSILMSAGFSSGQGSLANSNYWPRLWLNSTTSVNGETEASSAVAQWCASIIQFKSGVLKSVQRGRRASGSGPGNITINSVNNSRAAVLHLGENSSSGTQVPSARQQAGQVISSTVLSAISGSNAGLSWEVVEF